MAQLLVYRERAEPCEPLHSEALIAAFQQAPLAGVLMSSPVSWLCHAEVRAGFFGNAGNLQVVGNSLH